MLVVSKMVASKKLWRSCIKCEYCLFFILILCFSFHFMLTVPLLFTVFCGELQHLFQRGPWYFNLRVLLNSYAIYIFLCLNCHESTQDNWLIIINILGKYNRTIYSTEKEKVGNKQISLLIWNSGDLYVIPCFATELCIVFWFIKHSWGTFSTS